MKKALLLIGISIIIIFFSTIGLITVYKKNINLVKQYNSEYEQYSEKTIYGVELAGIINKAIDENEKNEILKDEKNYYIENEENSIKIYIKILTTEKTYTMEEIYNKDITKFVQNFNLIPFKCSQIEYHNKTGKVSKIIFEEV